MKIAISGSRGLIGSHLFESLKSKDHQITRIVRETGHLKEAGNVVTWNIAEGKVETEKLEGQEAVIHLAGGSIAGGRWTPRYKKMIEDSRVEGTRLLAKTLVSLKYPPRILICASAVGYYGSGDFGRVDESSPKGKGFLAQVCENWEMAAMDAQSRGIRVVFLRFGVVLSRKGGALAKMLPAFQLGLGGRTGSGQQIISWIALDEIPRIISHVIAHGEIKGAVNCVSPRSVSNAVFTKTLGEVLGRPTIFPVPSLAIKILFGEMGEELLLCSSHVAPKVLQNSGYQFQYEDLKAALVVSLRR